MLNTPRHNRSWPVTRRSVSLIHTPPPPSPPMPHITQEFYDDGSQHSAEKETSRIEIMLEELGDVLKGALARLSRLEQSQKG